MNFLINDYTGDIKWDRLIFPINMTFLVLAFLILFFLKGNTIRKKLRKRFLVMLLFFLNLVVCACFYDSDGDNAGIGAFFYFTPILISLVISFFCWLASLLKILVVSKKAYWHKGFLYRKGVSIEKQNKTMVVMSLISLVFFYYTFSFFYAQKNNINFEFFV